METVKIPFTLLLEYVKPDNLGFVTVTESNFIDLKTVGRVAGTLVVATIPERLVSHKLVVVLGAVVHLYNSTKLLAGILPLESNFTLLKLSP